MDRKILFLSIIFYIISPGRGYLLPLCVQFLRDVNFPQTNTFTIHDNAWYVDLNGIISTTTDIYAENVDNSYGIIPLHIDMTQI